MAREDDGRVDEGDSGEERKRRSQAGLSTTAVILIVLGVAGAVMFGCLLLLVALLLPAVQQARFAARTAQSKNNLKQVGLAVHNFHDAYQHLPPMGPKDLKPGEVPQSWMTELLPYVGQAPAYNLINRQAPWDDASNRRAMSVVIPIYLDPNLPGKTTDPVAGCGLSHYAGNTHIFGGENPLSMRDFKDGTSNTMLAGSVTNGLRPWGDPSNLRDPAAGLGPTPTQFDSALPGEILILLADGSVRSVSTNASPQVMQGLAKPDDDVVPSSDF